MRLQNKVAIITGAARGIGAEIARLFAHEGAKVILADILEEQGQQVASEISDAGGQSLFLRLDVTSEEGWAQTVDEAVGRYGTLDVLVNNAAVLEPRTVEETTVDGWDWVMAVNAKGTFLGTRAAILAMRRSGGGSIVNVSSISGMIGGDWVTAYTASKGAIRLFTKSAAIQYAKEGIRVNSLHPGPVETDMLTDAFEDLDALRSRASRIPLGRFGSPEDMAYGALYLASDESSYVTGSELVVDGGALAQ